MGKYLQILLTRAYELPPISNCNILHIHYGIDGWLEECNDQIRAFRFVSQKHIDKQTIMQIVEEMEDGWMPSKILLKDTVFSNNETVGIWNRVIMELPPIQLAFREDMQMNPSHPKNQHPQTHASAVALKKQPLPALLPTPPQMHQKKIQGAKQSRASCNNKTIASNNYSSQPSSYNKSHKPLKSQYKNQSLPTLANCLIVLPAAKPHQ